MFEDPPLKKMPWLPTALSWILLRRATTLRTPTPSMTALEIASDTLLSIMERLNKERGATFLFSTHDPKVMDRARRLVRLVDGRVDKDEKR